MGIRRGLGPAPTRYEPLPPDPPLQSKSHLKPGRNVQRVEGLPVIRQAPLKSSFLQRKKEAKKEILHTLAAHNVPALQSASRHPSPSNLAAIRCHSFPSNSLPSLHSLSTSAHNVPALQSASRHQPASDQVAIFGKEKRNKQRKYFISLPTSAHNVQRVKALHVIPKKPGVPPGF